MKRAFTAALVLNLLASFINPALAAPACKAIRFARGTTSAVVEGIAPNTDTEVLPCYTLGAGQGQTATLTISSKDGNAIFTIDDVIDAQDKYSFTTDKKTYKIEVGQLMASPDAEKYKLTIAIK